MDYIELFQQDPGTIMFVLVLSLVITVVAYGAFPFIFAKTRKKPVTKKKYRWLCYGINFAVMMPFIVVNGEASGGPYLLWTWIFSRWGEGILCDRGCMLDGDYLPNDPNRMVACKTCGYRDKNFFDACPRCGHHAKKYVLVTPTSPTPRAVASQPVRTATPAKAPAQVRFCRKCGTKLAGDGNFCHICGTQIKRT